MTKEKIQKELDELGIISIEACGDLSSGLINDAIEATKTVISHINLSEIAEEINQKERCVNDDI